MILFSIFTFSQTTKEEIDSLLTNVNPQLKFKLTTAQSIKWNEDIIDKSNKLNYDKGAILGYINIANILWINSRYEESIKYLDIALAKAEKKKEDFSLLGKIYMEYAQIYNSMDLNDIAMEKSDLAIKYFKKQNFKSKKQLLAYAYGSQAVYLFEANKNEEALQRLHKAISNVPYVTDLCNIAYYYTDIKYNEDSAQHYLNKSFELLKISDANTDAQLAEVFRFQGNLEFKKGDLKKSETSYLKSEQLTEKSKLENLYLKFELFKSLMNVYGKLNQTDKVKEYQEKYNKVKKKLDENVNKGVSHSMKNLMKNNESEKKRANRQTQIIIIISLFVILFVSISLFIIKRNKKLISSKTKALSEKTIESEELKVKLDESLDELLHLARKNDTAFLIKFEKVYPNFSNNLLAVNPALVNSEILFCALLTLNFSNKELAKFTFTLTKTIENRKTRIRKRLNIPLDENINLWMKRFL